MKYGDLVNSSAVKIKEWTMDSLSEYFAPEGTDPKAVIDQWTFGILYNFPLYAEEELHELDINRISLRNLLKSKHDQKSIANLKQKILQNTPFLPPKKSNFNFIDLFAGIGGMRQAFQNAKGHCVFTSELDTKAQETYFENYGELPFGDITKIPPKNIPDHDVLVGGFPCQPFSNAGLKLGVKDTRGTLFNDIVEIVKAKSPKFVVLENVVGLISNDNGHTITTIINAMYNVGYRSNISPLDINSPKIIQKEAKKMVLKSSDFGIPQGRRRIFLVFWKKSLSIEQFNYPKPSMQPTRLGDILVKNPDSKYTISDKLWSGHKTRRERNRSNGKGFGYNLYNHDAAYTATISARYYKDGSEILIEQAEGRNPRKLTPREAARLQGFPDNFIINKSDTQAYKQFGNSVTIPVVEAIAINISSSFK